MQKFYNMGYKIEIEMQKFYNMGYKIEIKRLQLIKI